MTRRGTALALLLLVTAVAVWGFLRLAPRPPVSGEAPEIMKAPPAEAASTSPFSAESGARSAHPLTAVEVSPAIRVTAEGRAARDAGAGAVDAVAALVAELERLDAERPITFHEEAARLLEAFVTAEIVTRAGSEATTAALEAELDARVHSARVGGALLAVLGGWGGAGTVFARLSMNDAEELRSGIAGLAWDAGKGDAEEALLLRPMDFLSLQPRAGLNVLDLAWSRPPGEVEKGWLLAQARVPAGDLASLLQRELAVMALGVEVDQSADALEQFRIWLMDRDANVQQLRPVIAYVLAHAHGAAAREVLQRFLEDGQVGDYGKLLARWWLSKQPAMEGDLKSLAAPLMDENSTEGARILAAGALLSRISDASEADLAQLEELLSMRVLQEQNDSARMAAIAVLASVPGGFARLGALEQTLRAEADPRHRKVAARGLAGTQGALRQEALSMLRAALGFEKDPDVSQYIGELLATSGQ